MSKKLRLIIILLSLAAATWMIWPTVNWYFILDPATKELAQASRDYIREQTRQLARNWIQKLRSLAKDNPDSSLPPDLEFLIPVAEANYRLLGQPKPDKWTVTTVSKAFRGEREVAIEIENHFREKILAIKETKGLISLGLDLSGGLSMVIEADWDKLAQSLGKDSLTPQEKEDAVQRALEVLRNRVDSFGVTEPQIKREPSGNRIYLDLPGDGARQQAEALLRSQGSLSFNIVNDEAMAQLSSQFPVEWRQEGFQPPPGSLAEGLKVVGLYEKDRYGLDRFKQNLVIMTDPTGSMSGRYIQDALVDRDRTTGEPNVIFSLTGEGATLFFQLTSAHVGKTMAVVMDGRAKAGARISETIAGGNVRVTGFDLEAANQLKTVLRSGSLPVDLSIRSARQIGASLGEDTVRRGLNAIIWGFAAVLIFMIVYYKGAGINAVIGLLFNIFFLLSLLSAFGLTLTMTSIAGLVLTAGMAVDANVIIFERIKEEWFGGKTPAMAVKAGFDRAFWTIFDSNITTLVASLSLSLLGSGPIQGFGVTLSTGIVTTLFSAIFVSRFLFDFSIDVLKPKKLSITWRKIE